MKSSQYIIFNWIYTVILINIFYWFVFPANSVWIWAYRASMFFMLLLLPMFLKFALDDIESEYNEMWRQLQYYGRIQ